MLWSDAGCVATLAGLALWAHAAGSVWPVVALYWGPYMFVNFWLVLYTWLQHTDVDVPHYGCAPPCRFPRPPSRREGRLCVVVPPPGAWSVLFWFSGDENQRLTGLFCAGRVSALARAAETTGRR